MQYQLVLKPSKLNTQVKPANCSDRPRPAIDTAVKHERNPLQIIRQHFPKQLLYFN